MTSAELTERGPACRVHQLKCWPPHFEDIAAGRKLADIRPDDRGFRVGDVIIQREWDHTVADTTDSERGQYTGRVCVCTITHIMRGGPFGLREGFVILSLGPVDNLNRVPFSNVFEYWYVFWGGDDPNNCGGSLEHDDEEDCRKFIALIGGHATCGIARQVRYVGPMEVVTGHE